MKADRDAPVYASAGAKIAAAPTSAWRVLTRFADWPEWNADVRSLRFDGPLASGTQFRWRQGTATIVATLQTVEPPRFVSWSAQVFATWTGGLLAIDAIHQYELSPVEGGTLVVTTESWNGLLARMLTRSLQRRLQRSCNNAIAALKAEAEQPADRDRMPSTEAGRFAQTTRKPPSAR